MKPKNKLPLHLNMREDDVGRETEQVSVAPRPYAEDDRESETDRRNVIPRKQQREDDSRCETDWGFVFSPQYECGRETERLIVTPKPPRTP